MTSRPPTRRQRFSYSVHERLAKIETDLRWGRRWLAMLTTAILSPKIGGPDPGQAIAFVAHHLS